MPFHTTVVADALPLIQAQSPVSFLASLLTESPAAQCNILRCTTTAADRSNSLQSPLAQLLVCKSGLCVNKVSRDQAYLSVVDHEENKRAWRGVCSET